MAKGDSRRLKISFNGPAEPRIINATPESCLVKQPDNTKPIKEKLAKKAMQKKIRVTVKPALKNQSFGEIPPPLTSVGGAIAVPAPIEKVSVTMFARLNRIKEEAKKVLILEAELNEEKKRLLGELDALEKKVEGQEQEWTQYFDAIRKEVARLTLT